MHQTGRLMLAIAKWPFAAQALPIATAAPGAALYMLQALFDQPAKWGKFSQQNRAGSPYAPVSAMFKVLAAIAAATTVFASVSDKFCGCRRRCEPYILDECPPDSLFCSPDLAREAAIMLAQDFRQMVTAQNLGGLQGGILVPNGALATNLFNSTFTCAPSQPEPLLAATINLIPQISLVGSLEDIQTEVVSSGYVLVGGQGFFDLRDGPEPPSFPTREFYVFAPICGTCRFRLVFAVLEADVCIPDSSVDP